MSERINGSQQEVIPGVEWPEPLQSELPFDMLLDQWSEDEIVSLLDDLHQDLHLLDESKSIDAGIRYETNQAFENVWDYAINRGVVQCQE